MTVEIGRATSIHVDEVRIDRQVIDSDHGPVRVTRFYPPMSYTWRHTSDEEPIVLSHGWAEGQSITASFADAVAMRGREIVTFDYPVSRTRIDVQKRRAEVLAGVVESLDSQSVDMIAHSEGAFAALTIARQGMVRKLLLAAPAGLIGPTSPSALIDRAARESAYGVYGKMPDAIWKTVLNGMKATRYVGQQPRLSLEEIASIARADAKPDLLALSGSSVRLGIVACRHDRIFPPRLLRAHLGDALDAMSYRELDTNHFDFLTTKKVQEEILLSLEQL